MSDLLVGQVLSLRIWLPYCGIFESKHPYLILKVDNAQSVVEVGQLHSLKGKPFEAMRETNKVLFASSPQETVIDEDSFIQNNNRIVIENYAGLTHYRRQEDTLSKNKLDDVIKAYNDYHKHHLIDDDHIVYLTKKDIEELNT